MNKISSWAIRNPVATTVLFLFLTLLGLVSFSKLRLNNLPDIDPPTVTVSVVWAGAAPTEIETQVTRLIEDSVTGLGNVNHVRSTVNEGISSSNVEFAIGTDIDRATNDVRNAVMSTRSKLPQAALDPIIQRVDATGQAVLTFIVDAPAMAPDDLSWFIDNDIAKAALAVPGVSRISRSGGVDAEISVKLDPDRLMALGLTAFEVSDLIKSQNINQPGGRVTLGAAEQTIRAVGSALDVAALRDMRLAFSDGRSIRLADLGVVERSWAEPRQRARFNDREVVGFSVYRAVGTGEIAVTRDVRRRMTEFEAAHPGIRIVEVTTSTDAVVEGYNAALEALALGALLAVLVVWLFLRDLRATLISSVALPMSLIPTFAIMYALNQSLNNISLLAIAIVVGILVDDAIVEIENIVRHVRQSGKSVYDAAIDAADEIGLAVVATTFAIIAVFMPVGLMPGIPGQFFKSFSIAVCSSVFFSLVVARLLTPLMAAFLLKTTGNEQREPAWVRQYTWMLDWTLRRRWITIFAGVVFFLGSLSLVRFLPAEFMPAADQGRSILAVELAPGATLQETDTVTQKVMSVLRARPEVGAVYSALGTQTSLSFGPDESPMSAGEVRKATITINLVPRSQRTLSQQAFEASVGPELSRIAGARIRFGGEGSSGTKVQVSLLSDDPVALASSVRQLVQEMRSTPGFQRAAATSSVARPELQIVPKADKAAALGVSTTMIARTVNIATIGDVDRDLAKFSLNVRQIPIRVLLNEDARTDLSRISNLQVPTFEGPLPLSAVADVTFGAGPNQIERINRTRSETVEAELSGITIGEAEDVISKLPSISQLPASVIRKPEGDAERMQELFSSFTLAIISGIALLFFVLALLFNGFVQPVTILTALPLSLGGALGLLLVTGTSISLPVLIGILMLMGIAAKNSILLVEYAIVAQRDSGLDRAEALLDAARKRARPIVMTTVAMGAGMLPIALGIGADAETRAPMAIAIIGGLVSSTVLSLVYVPAVFTVMDDLERWIRNRFLSSETQSA
ncbi:efflux RND transporter permease subunit [Pseudorhodoplanes sinuspersici]|uniref:ABC transporter permease n=1 Tax=Pseudorhodoplanes sinuspersici TaxID=1235591 RepID=A0A1W6ZKI7_9HYPH|nr:efflux RND transporter permease subunit [Pseudorhodoplanes sinuspersici]ARP97859.1 ABC transporter permease [Pseudorhodoplanes sinuspersici]RKE68407.1 HAE1 family hydrophobic/amphiphilic exporter-1 [Pseudorhodoplanes sinuspersici]